MPSPLRSFPHTPWVDGIYLVLPDFRSSAGWSYWSSLLGAFLLIGLATRFWAVVWGSSDGRDHVVGVECATQSGIGLDLLMLLVHLALFATAAGRYAGLDGLLRPSWAELPVFGWARWLVRGVMRTHDRLDRAALALGVVSIVGVLFVFVHGAFQLVQIGAAGLVVALVLGLLAVVGAWLDERTLMIAAGLGFLLPAVSSSSWRGQQWLSRRPRIGDFVVVGIGCRADRSRLGGSV